MSLKDVGPFPYRTSQDVHWHSSDLEVVDEFRPVLFHHELELVEAHPMAFWSHLMLASNLRPEACQINSWSLTTRDRLSFFRPESHLAQSSLGCLDVGGNGCERSGSIVFQHVDVGGINLHLTDYRVLVVRVLERSPVSGKFSSLIKLDIIISHDAH